MVNPFNANLNVLIVVIVPLLTIFPEKELLPVPTCLNSLPEFTVNVPPTLKSFPIAVVPLVNLLVPEPPFTVTSPNLNIPLLT